MKIVIFCYDIKTMDINIKWKIHIQMAAFGRNSGYRPFFKAFFYREGAQPCMVADLIYTLRFCAIEISTIGLIFKFAYRYRTIK